MRYDRRCFEIRANSLTTLENDFRISISTLDHVRKDRKVAQFLGGCCQPRKPTLFPRVQYSVKDSSLRY